MSLITILGEDDFTRQFYVQKGGDSRNSGLVDLIQDKMAIFTHIWPNLVTVWPKWPVCIEWGQQDCFSGINTVLYLK